MHRNKTGMPWADYLNFRTSQRKRALPETHGIRCADCRRVHPYNGQDKLDIAFTEGPDTRIIITWLCPYTQIVLGTMRYASSTN